jgi:hypothetical protein
MLNHRAGRCSIPGHRRPANAMSGKQAKGLAGGTISVDLR